MGFFRPFGAASFARPPRACALGCILSPLRGWGTGGAATDLVERISRIAVRRARSASTV